MHADTERSRPVPCTVCGTDVWGATMGACDTHFRIAWHVFAKHMGWEPENTPVSSATWGERLEKRKNVSAERQFHRGSKRW